MKFNHIRLTIYLIILSCLISVSYLKYHTEVIYTNLGQYYYKKNEGVWKGRFDGVKKATLEVPLRTNVVDPLTRVNTGNNIGKGIPQINVELSQKEELEITVFPKGFGSENNNKLAMLLPGEGIEGILHTIHPIGGRKTMSTNTCRCRNRRLIRHGIETCKKSIITSSRPIQSR